MANTEKPAREKKADYFYLAPDGTRVDEIESAAGVEYVPTAGGNVKWLIDGTVGSKTLMLAVAGAKIELRNAGRGEAEPADGSGKAAQRVARMKGVEDGGEADWGDLAGQGGGRAPIDDDRLLAAMVTVLTAKGKPFNESKIKAGFADGGTIAGNKHADGKSYKAACLKIDGVEAEYNRLGGKATTVESIADDDFA
jgi:hypothetical protein